ncbi:M15 family metallopeptidase [Nocardiopsis sp. MT53]|uniref:M15 family metallopeptidase n=1 Tax=Nocardiopsis changdeensis TaxID=2831969 RepID=A0ABX8BGT0_9ACTN|nr:M15 family metallopeptidase [Nocardiopsis changdeensis]QYX37272.1 M15 family metallopeptidase [Nocardiopsis sp. MT53]
MCAVLRPSSNTLGNDRKAERSGSPTRVRSAGPAFSVRFAFPVGLAVLAAFSCPSPAAAEDPVVELATLRAELEGLRAEAGERIEEYIAERELLEELAEEGESARERVAEARARGEASRLAVARQAAAVYKGADLSPARVLFGAQGPAGMLDLAADLSLIGDHRSAELGRARAAGVAADTHSETAREAEREQEEATERADEAREEAEEAIRVQEKALAGLIAEQTRLEARREAGEGAPREARDAPASGALPGPEPGAGTGPAADAPACAGGDVSAHSNGRIPDSLLCPLPQPGERLRADAAAAFIDLDAAYRERFGRAMCVTDSYRPYHEQVSLFEQMLPGMAARPGTSTHGMGLAVDLCGGVNVPGSPEHEWMLDRAPGFGWDNPPWARGGFEPWHWEYTP